MHSCIHKHTDMNSRSSTSTLDLHSADTIADAFPICHGDVVSKACSDTDAGFVANRGHVEDASPFSNAGLLTDDAGGSLARAIADTRLLLDLRLVAIAHKSSKARILFDLVDVAGARGIAMAPSVFSKDLVEGNATSPSRSPAFALAILCLRAMRLSSRLSMLGTAPFVSLIESTPLATRL